jgi:undecaprenyl diphosphate synthase
MLIESPELRASYAACAEEVRRFPAIWAGVEVLPAELRPYLHALNAFGLRSDRIADEGETADEGEASERGRAVARWRSETMAELRAGRSEHALRRALVDTVRRWDLDLALIEEYFDALQADCASAPVYETFVDLGRYLRGIGGAFAELWAPLLGVGGDRGGLLSVVGELFQLVDILEDLPIDLAAGRCYLPRADLRRLGLEVADLRRAERCAELDELMEAQLVRGRELVEQAIPVIETAAAECQPFLQTVILGAQVQLDEVELLRHRVLTEGLAPPTSAKAPLPEPGPVPDHIAVIMDGNRRWATQRGLPAAQGHRAGERALVRTVHAALRLGVRHLTVYMFSTENWNRPGDELDDLFATMAEVITRSAEWLHGCGVRIRWAGRRDRLDPSLASLLALFESMTSNNTALTLTLCIDYGGRDELAAAARALAAEAVAGAIRPEEIGPADLARHLYTPELPDVDLLIRTSGEHRISNFLPWQLAYAELVFDPALWPDFGLSTLRRAIADYARRRRTFGGDLVHQRDAASCAMESAGM